ncbi:small acid-soluble spore protein Tlp [Alkalicoccobacillus plakortidis]|uniref:Small, acid-soluble spore protein Tlp n=1 Tax=Alkalicoccobacillus plakortidis TaxID=444060 RepID=A0ABT0XED7_9BACI|nr:small acid-soluble spore protein Tlp [Alkalicoccobacillus plakortidis]MCM2674256.1 small acid-soluble spore protein Tlp [Alkalicoccobacillus plakortidis]
MANPDNRTDNAQKIKEIINHTEQKINETEHFIAAHGDEMDDHDKQDITDKNKRRETSINSLRHEIEDES